MHRRAAGNCLATFILMLTKEHTHEATHRTAGSAVPPLVGLFRWLRDKPCDTTLHNTMTFLRERNMLMEQQLSFLYVFGSKRMDIATVRFF